MEMRRQISIQQGRGVLPHWKAYKAGDLVNHDALSIRYRSSIDGGRGPSGTNASGPLANCSGILSAIRTGDRA